MKKSNTVVMSLFLLLGSVTFSYGARATVCEQLTEAQMAQIQNGQQVLCTEDVKGSAWPRIFVYQRIEATPEEAAAVFFDYERVKTYVEKITYSHVSKVIDPRTKEIDYVMSVPVVNDEHFTVRNQLAGLKDAQGEDQFRFDWTKVRSDSSKEILGYAVFSKLGTSTLLAYMNFVKPSVPFAGMFKGQAIKQVTETMQATSKHIEESHLNPVQALNEELEQLRKALSSKQIETLVDTEDEGELHD